MEELAPLRYAYDWDNSGVNLYLHDDVERILVCLEVTPAVVEEAAALGCDTIVCHHPMVFRPIKGLRKANPVENLVLAAVQARCNVYAAHTSFDCAPKGMNAVLADKLGLTRQRLLAQERTDGFCKIVVFVPQEAAEKVKEALFSAGAGGAGAYSRVSFSAPGTGEFFPGAGSHPARGRAGSLEQVPELRIECMCPEGLAEKAAAAAREAHPYEEPAIDIIPLAYPKTPVGIGVVGELLEEMPLADFLAMAKEKLEAPLIRFSGSAETVRRIACVGGAGGEFFPEARRAGADVLLTGEAKYNHFADAAAMGIVLAEAGHYDTEKGFVDAVSHYLQKRINRVQYIVHVHSSRKGERPYRVL